MHVRAVFSTISLQTSQHVGDSRESLLNGLHEGHENGISSVFAVHRLTGWPLPLAFTSAFDSLALGEIGAQLLPLYNYL